MKHVQRLQVLSAGKPVGMLAQGERGAIFFQYDASWLQQGFDLAPGSLAFDTSLQRPREARVFGGLHGVFNDSLPDGWGLLLMDRALRASAGWAPRDITPLDRLAYIGNRAMGALEYVPELAQGRVDDPVDLAALAQASQALLAGSTQDVLAQLRIQGGSPGGARPKVTVARNPQTQECLSGFLDLPPGFEHWMVKFRSQNDPLDMGRVECAYADVAQAAGVAMSPVDLLHLTVDGQPEAYFAVQRFDRSAGRKLHVLSLGAYLYASHREPSLDYEALLAATLKLTRDVREVERAFRLMSFNVLMHNRDDHAKNFSFVFDEAQRQWRLSPAYDLTFSEGMGTEHTTAVNGRGNPARADLVKLAKAFSITQADRIIDEVRAAVSTWPEVAGSRGVQETTVREIGGALLAIDKRFM